MFKEDGVLVPMDEYMNHQMTDTFATVLQSDRSWTEKVCLSVGAKDGSMQIGFGLGKYLNRNVMDCYAGISRGVEQWTVRGSRQLFPEPDTYGVGPIHYEVIEPLKKIRIRLDQNDTQPIAFDVLLDCSEIPPFLEEHEFRRQLGGYRIDNDLVRYHQTGVPSGWLMIDDVKHTIDADNWYCTRDHSWGVRYGVGDEPTDVMPGIDSSMFPMNFSWSPMRMVDSDGSTYAIHHFYLKMGILGVPEICQGGVEYADGSKQLIDTIDHQLQFNPMNRRLLGGDLILKLQDGSQRTLHLEVVSDTGFHLGTGLYFGFDGKHHGQWRGELNIEGEYFSDCASRETAERIHQIRDCIVKITDGNAVGYSNIQTTVTGEWTDLGLKANDTFW